jgi:DNA-binding response OmpR family regulator
MRLLFVDDNSDTIELYREYFALLGHEVDLAHTAYRGLNLVSANEYDAIVLDIMLPDLDGYVLACHIRRLSASRKHLSLVAVSATPFEPTHPLAATADFDAYLLKPVHLDVITASLLRYAE